ncbi:DUF2252 family protein [Geodermatophilus sabuli]|uniref:Uncharacterized protein n=1 Tax=Geodermatophilus sabuli TaxID=1564158 RepID=A0A285EE56_9ACTN|nr:DUF2252 family protein [Geodermatophilus sabuli]MBB3084490.1 hypothetical protein [Geodermatophilus sabuli]SNX97315.1 hypothetical protein SAMN06893097_106265 [Geodermatophilus sabuli]
MLTATAVPPDQAAAQNGRPTPQQRKATGKALRAAVPLDAHAESPRATRSRDPLTLLEEQAVDRLPELGPIRYGRMLQSPFAYYRGAARVMAADLAGARYRAAMAEFAAARDIEVWYSRLDAEEFRDQLAPRLEAGMRKRLTRALERARTRDTLQPSAS